MSTNKTNKTSSRKRFPIGEVAQQRKILKENYLAQNVKIIQLSNDLKLVENDVQKVSKKIQRRIERLELLSHSIQDQSSSDACRNDTRVSFKRKLTTRQQTYSKVHPENSEEFQCSPPKRSCRRRRKETLDACKQIHCDQGEQSSPLAGMWVTLVNKASPEVLKGYLSTSPKVNGIIPSMVNS